MAVESAADRAAFVSADEFGALATWEPAGRPASALSGILDEPTDEKFAGGPGLRSTDTTLTVRTADIPADAQFGERTGDRVTIGARRFAPIGRDLDATGDMTVVILNEVKNEG